MTNNDRKILLVSLCLMSSSALLLRGADPLALTEAGIQSERQIIAAKSDAISERMVARNRTRDAFGLTPLSLLSDPSEENSGGGNKPASPAGGGIAPASSAPVVAFCSALANLEIDGIDPQNKEFYVGSRNVYEGNKITIKCRGVRFQATVVSIRQNEVVFKDLSTGECATVRLKIIPSINDTDMPNMEKP